MQTLVTVLVAIVAVAFVVQALVMVAIYYQFRRTSAILTQTVTKVEAQLSPLLSRVDRLLEDSQGHLSEIVGDTAEIVRLVKLNGKKFDRLVDEATDRLGAQIVHAVRLVTGALETLEDGSAQLRKSILEPVRHAAALIQGVKAGVGFFCGSTKRGIR
jgi:predicted PurR-regulated permease PerM